jgi:type VII secretion integral membrane protein EccD
MLVLTTTPIARPRFLPTESAAVVAATADDRSGVPGHGAVFAAGLIAVAMSAPTLVRAGLEVAGGWPLWSGAILSTAAAAVSVAVGRTSHRVAALLCTAAVVYGAATGILATPGAAWQPTYLLAAAVAFAISTVLLRVRGRDVVLTAFTAATGAMAVSAAVCFTVPSRPEVAGAVLAVVSLGALTLAPALTVVAAGLDPARSAADERRAAGAHRTLTGLVAGWSASAALGAVAVAAAAVHTRSSAALAAVFAADLGILLLLRQRSHIDRCRRTVLGAAGFAAVLAAALATVATVPAPGFWICVAAATICGAGLRSAEEPNPLARRAKQVVEYVALAAVFPLACWVTGLYGVVRGLSLP